MPNGHVIAWGDNSYGQCDVPPEATNVVAISAGYFHSVALRSDGTVLAWGAAIDGATDVPIGLNNVTAVAAGEGFTLVLVELGPPLSFDRPRLLAGHVGESIGLETSVQGESPLSFQWFHDGTAITGSTSPFLSFSNLSAADAGLYFLVASNAAGVATNPSITLSVNPAPYIADDLGHQSVPVGHDFCLTPGVMGAPPFFYQWQTNGVNAEDGARMSGTHTGQVCVQKAQGQDSGVYSLIVSNGYGTITQVVAEVSVTEVLAWGDNGSQQIEVPIGTTKIASLAAGGDHSLALRRDGTVFAWGDNFFGQSSVPSEATNVIGVAAGENHSAALREDGTVVVWGDNSYGQTNLPIFSTNVTAIAAGGNHSVALLADGSFTIWGKNPTPLTSPTNPAIAVAAGGDQTLVLLNDGTVFQTGNPYPSFVPGVSDVVAIAAGRNHSLALTSSGLVLAWGNNYYGQAAVPGVVTNAVAIAAGDNQSLAVLSDGTIVGWGANEFGQSSPPDAHPLISAAGGGAHSLALMETVINAPAPVFQLLAPSLTMSNGIFRVRLSHLFGSGPSIISVSSDLQTWQPIYTNPPTTGELDFLDPFPLNLEQRFYRAVEQR
jgi:alpha-tubulin suppressor-like RCC1 family protein